MDKYTLIINDDRIVIQKAEYIEDGFYVEIHRDTITLFEIPVGGGKEIKIGEFPSVLEAIKRSTELS